MVLQQMAAWRTPWIDNKPAVAPSHSEALALDTQACDLAFLEDILQAGEVLNLPHKLALEVLASADTLGLDCPCFCTDPFYAATEGACFFDNVKSCREGGCVILHISSLSIPEHKFTNLRAQRQDCLRATHVKLLLRYSTGMHSGRPDHVCTNHDWLNSCSFARCFLLNTTGLLA